MGRVVMHLPYAMPDGDQDGMSKDALVIIDEERFSQECLVEAIRSAFPRMPVIGIPTVEELSHVDRDAVGLVLLRVQLYSLSGCQLAHETGAILQHCPDAPIVILSKGMNATTVREAIASGVRGIIPVTTSFKIAVAAIQLVMVGGTYYPCCGNGDLKIADGAKDMSGLVPEASEPLVSPQAAARPYLTITEHTGDAFKTNANEANVIFTARELDVLEALQKGWSNKWIAHSLCISENTIKVHIQRIMRKLHAINRTEAVVRHRELNGLRYGLSFPRHEHLGSHPMARGTDARRTSEMSAIRSSGEIGC
jgi:DNA-binding NarL/FixJ family response regulator